MNNSSLFPTKNKQNKLVQYVLMPYMLWVVVISSFSLFSVALFYYWYKKNIDYDVPPKLKKNSLIKLFHK